jgi:UDP-glucuronate 4-epimerase
MQPGDVKDIYADITDLQMDVGLYPTTMLEIGLGYFIDWYIKYHLK